MNCIAGMRTMGKDVKNNSIGRYAAAKFHPNHQVVEIDNTNDIALNVLIDAMEPEMLWELIKVLKHKRYKK